MEAAHDAHKSLPCENSSINCFSHVLQDASEGLSRPIEMGNSVIVRLRSLQGMLSHISQEVVQTEQNALVTRGMLRYSPWTWIGYNSMAMWDLEEHEDIIRALKAWQYLASTITTKSERSTQQLIGALVQLREELDKSCIAEAKDVMYSRVNKLYLDAFKVRRISTS